MTSLRALAPAKINLGLFVGPTRPDGRHELVSVMQSISLADELTLERVSSMSLDGAPQTPAGEAARGHAAGGTQWPASLEIICPQAPELAGPNNLAALALTLFRERTGWDPGPLRLTIQKRVPVAAGMGGGSGDAAAALRLAAQMHGLSDELLLRELAGALGADVPAQVEPGRWLATGAGELLEPLAPPQTPFGVLVLPLAQALSTAAVYRELDRMRIARAPAELRERRDRLRLALAHGAQLPPLQLLCNDLERVAVSLCPQIDEALEQAREAGADVALLSGSGPTVLGLFGGPDGPTRAERAADGLAGRNPPAIAAVPVGAERARAVCCCNN